MFYKAVIIVGVLITRTTCNAWNDNFVRKETWLNGVEKPEEYLLKLEEGIVFADESDMNGFKMHEKKAEDFDIYNSVAEDEDKEELEAEDCDESQFLHDYFTTITTSTFGSQSTHISDLQAENDHLEDVCSQLHIKKLKEVGVDEIIKNAWGIAYSFYEPTGGCKSAQEIQSEVKQLADFDIIRVYDTGCEGLINVVKALRPGQQVFADIYCLDRIEVSVEIITQAINSIGGDWSVIHTVSVGDELINLNEAAVAEIDTAIGRTKDLLYERGYHGFVVSTVTLAAMMNHRELCDMSDYISVNLCPHWDGFVSPQEARPWLKQQMTLLQSICGHDRNVVLSATGWPTRGLPFGERVLLQRIIN
jgi:exo-beta-1,3-glucanase (GH17 family)